MPQNQTLEQQLEALTKEIERRKQLPQAEGGQVEVEPKLEKEHLHDIIGEKIYGESEWSGREEKHEDLPATHGDEDRSYNLPELHDKVQKLIEHVFEKDLESAIKEIKTSNDAALVDAFHDALVDELHDHLVNRGKLNPL